MSSCTLHTACVDDSGLFTLIVTYFTQQIDSLEQSLEETRTASLPKKKFAFKRGADRPSLSAAPTSPPSSQAIPPQPERDHLAAAPSTFRKISAHSNCRISLQSLPTFKDDTASDLTISDLSRCIVDLCSPAKTTSPHQLSLTALHIRDLKDTILILPNVKGSVLLHNLHTCTVIAACHQARIPLSDIRDCSYLLHPVPHR